MDEPQQSPSPALAALLVLLGAAAGAAVTLALTSPKLDRLAPNGLDRFVPGDLMSKATRALEKTRDAVIDAVDAKSRDS